MLQEEKIKAYLLGQLSDEETANFKAEILADPDLTIKVKRMKVQIITDEMQLRAQLREKMKEWDKESPFPGPVPWWQAYRRPLLSGMAAVMVGVVVWAWWSGGPGAGEQTPMQGQQSEHPVQPLSNPVLEQAPMSPAVAPPSGKPEQKKTIPSSMPIALNENDMKWIEDHNIAIVGSSAGYAPPDSIAILCLLVKQKKFRKAINWGSTMWLPSDQTNLNIAIAYFGLGEENKALKLSNAMLKKGVILFQTRNCFRLLSAKCYYKKGEKDTCRILLSQIQEDHPQDSRFMGEAFWEAVENLLKLIKK